MIQFIWGLGSGRCGTGTLAKFLDKQKGISSFHEGQFCPWEKDLVAFYQSVITLVNKTTEANIATVAFYWRNYLSEIFRDFNNPKLIVLKRQKEKVVESFASMYADRNYWSVEKGKNWNGNSPREDPLKHLFPKHDLPKKEAIAKYWEDYYNDGEIDYWMKKFPGNIIIIKSEDLWEGEDAQKEILKFLAIPKKDWVLDPSIWEHKRREQGKVLQLNRHPPIELIEMAQRRAHYGHAVDHAGLPTSFDFQLTEEEFQQIKEDPEIMKLLAKEEHA